MIESPCTQRCEIDARSGLCRGCGRSLDEIAAWTQLSPEARRAVMRRLVARRTWLARTAVADETTYTTHSVRD